MNMYKFGVSGIALIITLSSLAGCSSMRKMSGSNQGSDGIAVNEKLTMPPSLRNPASSTNNKSKNANVRRPAIATKAVHRSTKNYFIVVGTYPDQEQALDTFVRLSSIGLPGATMESRRTKSGKSLHMVRLGPYNNQEDIDKVKDSLTSDGLSQFKIVEN